MCIGEESLLRLQRSTFPWCGNIYIVSGRKDSQGHFGLGLMKTVTDPNP